MSSTCLHGGRQVVARHRLGLLGERAQRPGDRAADEPRGGDGGDGDAHADDEGVVAAVLGLVQRRVGLGEEPVARHPAHELHAAVGAGLDAVEQGGDVEVTAGGEPAEQRLLSLHVPVVEDGVVDDALVGADGPLDDRQLHGVRRRPGRRRSPPGRRRGRRR